MMIKIDIYHRLDEYFPIKTKKELKANKIRGKSTRQTDRQTDRQTTEIYNKPNLSTPFLKRQKS